MISDKRVEELNTYFYRDHRMRGRHLLITSGAGTGALLLCRLIFSLSEPLSFALAAGATAATFLSLVVSYSPQSLLNRPRSIGKAGTDALHPSVQFAHDKRLILVQIPFFAFAVVALAFLPKSSEAAVINNRVRRLLNEGRDSEAEETARAAIHVGIPLEPDVVRAAPSITYPASSYSAMSGRTVVQLLDAERITISIPIVYFTAGRWPTNGSLTAGEYPISMVGVGQDKAFLVVNAAVSKDSSVIIHSAHRTNTLIYGLTVVLDSGFRVGKPCFLTVKPGSSWAAVSNVVVRSLCQSLDRTIWQEVHFIGCLIHCEGDRFQIMNVTFAECRFDFADGFPEDVKARIEHSNGQPVSIVFAPSLSQEP